MMPIGGDRRIMRKFQHTNGQDPGARQVTSESKMELTGEQDTPERKHNEREAHVLYDAYFPRALRQ